jgi:hypothetical protein
MKSVISHMTSSTTIQQSSSVECFLISSIVTIFSFISSIRFQSDGKQMSLYKIVISFGSFSIGWDGGASSLDDLYCGEVGPAKVRQPR